ASAGVAGSPWVPACVSVRGCRIELSLTSVLLTIRSCQIPTQSVIHRQFAGCLPGILYEERPCLLPLTVIQLRGLSGGDVIAKQEIGEPKTLSKAAQTHSRRERLCGSALICRGA